MPIDPPQALRRVPISRQVQEADLETLAKLVRRTPWSTASGASMMVDKIRERLKPVNREQ
ncbi:MAG TPA: hypothetical protein VJK71_04700 [Gemmatimonadales bacterium]|nr:hypothetical protein [Gemmatimonadales bacterium]